MSGVPEREPTVQDLFDLTGKVALLTGGAGHLGSAMSRALAEAGPDYSTANFCTRWL